MTLKQIAALGRKLTVFLALFADCFGRKEPRELLRLYVRGQFSDLKHKNAEAIALKFGGKAPNFTTVSGIDQVDEEKLVDYTQKLVATRARTLRRRSASSTSLGCRRAESTRRG